MATDFDVRLGRMGTHGRRLWSIEPWLMHWALTRPDAPTSAAAVAAVWGVHVSTVYRAKAAVDAARKRGVKARWSYL
jgi:hypothetical protein